MSLQFKKNQLPIIKKKNHWLEKKLVGLFNLLLNLGEIERLAVR